jgi:hypothetical protein
VSNNKARRWLGESETHQLSRKREAMGFTPLPKMMPRRLSAGWSRAVHQLWEVQRGATAISGIGGRQDDEKKKGGGMAKRKKIGRSRVALAIDVALQVSGAMLP